MSCLPQVRPQWWFMALAVDDHDFVLYLSFTFSCFCCPPLAEFCLFIGFGNDRISGFWQGCFLPARPNFVKLQQYIVKVCASIV